MLDSAQMMHHAEPNNSPLSVERRMQRAALSVDMVKRAAE
jgi:hypothetical protein